MAGSAKSTRTPHSKPTSDNRSPSTTKRARRILSRVSGLWMFSFVILQSFFLQQALSPNNRVEIFPAELLFPTVILLIESLIIAVIVYGIRQPRTMGSKLTVVLLVSLFFIDYDTRLQSVSAVIQAVLPLLPKNGGRMPITSLVFMAMLIGVSLFIGRLVESAQKKNPGLSSLNIIGSLGIVVAVIAMGPFVDFAKTIPVLIRESQTQAPNLPGPVTSPTKKPDIYYIVLDRYTNNQVLSEQLTYDNSEFTNYLRQTGFFVNEGAYSNYPYTAISISSTMSASYTNTIVAPYKDESLQSHALYHNLIRQSVVVKALKANGYQYLTLGSWYGATNKNPLASRDYMSDATINIFGTPKHLRGIELLGLRSNPLYRFICKDGLSWLPISLTETDHPDYITKQLKTLRDLASSDRQGGRFIFAHVLVPHEPFFFNADGSLNTNYIENNVGKPVSQKYTDQIQFINAQMRELIDIIREKSGNEAIILLNADEGEYPQTVTLPGSQFSSTQPTYPDNMSDWPDQGLRMKYGVMQAVHIPGASADDLSHLSSVNMFRIILNRYAGYELPYLPNCNLALTRGSQFEYLYEDISDRFQYVPDPACSDFATSTSN